MQDTFCAPFKHDVDDAGIFRNCGEDFLTEDEDD